LARFAESEEALAGPCVEEIELAGAEGGAGDEVEVVFLSAVIVGLVEGGEEAHGMPAEGLDAGGGDGALAIGVNDGAAEDVGLVQAADRLEGVGIEARAAEAGGDGVKDAAGELVARQLPGRRRGDIE